MRACKFCRVLILFWDWGPMDHKNVPRHPVPKQSTNTTKFACTHLISSRIALSPEGSIFNFEQEFLYTCIRNQYSRMLVEAQSAWLTFDQAPFEKHLTVGLVNFLELARNIHNFFPEHPNNFRHVVSLILQYRFHVLQFHSSQALLVTKKYQKIPSNIQSMSVVMLKTA